MYNVLIGSNVIQKGKKTNNSAREADNTDSVCMLMHTVLHTEALYAIMSVCVIR